MVRFSKKNLVVYLVFLVVVVIACIGFARWTLSFMPGRSRQIPIIPNSDDRLKVLNPPAAASDHTRDLEPIAAIVAQVGSSVVKITTVKERVYYDFFFGQQQAQEQGEGSGVFIDDQGLILTNNHVVADADQIKVMWTDNAGNERELMGQVLGRDPLTDLAVVKVDAQEIPVAILGDSDQLQVGDTAIAIGNPYGFSSSVTVGVISALNRDLPIREGVELLDLIQTDAAINPGNSGGALFNLDGHVIGINTAMLQGAQGLGFAIPINLAREIVQQLIKNGVVTRPWVGIYGTTITPDIQKRLNLPVETGVLVTQVIADGPAQKAGLRNDDIIIEFAGAKLEGMQQLVKELRKYDLGARIKVVVIRDDQELSLTLTLEEHPGIE